MKSIILGISLITLPLMLIGISVAAINPDTIVGNWKLDENGGDTAFDSSGKGNDGVLVNGPTWTTGMFGSALEFDGADDVVDCGADVSLNPDAMTVVAWIKSMGPNGEGRVVNNMNDGDRGYFLMVSGTVLIPYVSNETHQEPYTVEGRVEFRSDMPDFGPDKWYHIAVTWDGSRVIVFANGSEIGSEDLGGIGRKNEQSLYIGGQKGTGRLFQGVIDEVAVFNVALSAADIQTVMNQGIAAAVSSDGKLATTWATMKTQ